MGEDSKRLLRQGIDLPKVKVALKDTLRMLQVDMALSGEPRRVQIHWTIHGPLRNWLRAEFPTLDIMSWPWGNWWEVRATTFPKQWGADSKPEVEIFRLVIPVNGAPR